MTVRRPRVARLVSWIWLVTGAFLLGWSLDDFSSFGWVLWICGSALLGAGLGMRRVVSRVRE